MPAPPVRCQVLPGRRAGRPRSGWALLFGALFWRLAWRLSWPRFWPQFWPRFWLLLCLCCAFATPLPAHAQGVELALLKTSRSETSLNLDFAVRVTLPRAAEDALMRGVPLYFVAEASLFRGRWYWRDERVARVARSWRVAFQPLTSSWRVSLAGLNQTYASLSEALTAASRSAGWRMADLSQLDPDKAYYVEFSYRLDSTQLPGPMQFGLGGGDWAVGVRRDLRVEL